MVILSCQWVRSSLDCQTVLCMFMQKPVNRGGSVAACPRSAQPMFTMDSRFVSAKHCSSCFMYPPPLQKLSLNILNIRRLATRSRKVRGWKLTGTCSNPVLSPKALPAGSSSSLVAQAPQGADVHFHLQRLTINGGFPKLGVPFWGSP